MTSTATTTSGGMVGISQAYLSDHPQDQETKNLIKGHPLALGTVQIIIGIIVFFFGVPMVIFVTSLGAFSGVFVWGAGIYITSGALTVAAGKSLSRCLVKNVLGFNLVSSLVAVTAIILYSFDIGLLIRCRMYDHGPHNEIPLQTVFNLQDHLKYNLTSNCDLYMTLSRGFSGIVTVFHVLEFVVSLTVSVFACRAICNCFDHQRQPSVYFNPGNTAMVAPAFYTLSVTTAVPAQQIPSFPKPENQNQIHPGLADPPAYTP